MLRAVWFAAIRKASYHLLQLTKAAASPGAQLPIAARTLATRASSSNGLERNSMAPALSARISTFSSACAVMKMVGILQLAAFKVSCSSRARHSRHMDVCDETSSPSLFGGFEELRSRRESSRLQANRFHQALESIAHRLIIIDDSNQFLFPFGVRHAQP